MSMTIENEKDTTPESGELVARQLRRELSSDEVLEELMARTGERGVALTGKPGAHPQPETSPRAG